ALIKGVPAGGRDDVLYLGKSASSYQITLGSGESWNTILDLETGYIVKYHYLIDIVFGDASTMGDTLIVTRSVVGYETLGLNLSAQLVDIDGGESLSSITLTGIPTGVELSAGSLQADGSWVV